MEFSPLEEALSEEEAPEIEGNKSTEEIKKKETPVIEGKKSTEESKKKETLLDGMTESDIKDALTFARELQAKLKSGELRLVSAEEVARTKEVTSEENQEDDILDEPVHFFAPTTRLAIFGYIDHGTGKPVTPPYHDCIEFNPITRYQDTKNRTISVCGVEVKSRKNLEFLLKSPDYGVTFFRTIHDASSVEDDFIKYEYIRSEMDRLNGMKRDSLMRELKENRININTADIKTLAKKLAVKLGNERYEKRMQRVKVRTSGKEIIDDLED
jgi:hypothetical protein